jgi:hypothetical protein
MKKYQENEDNKATFVNEQKKSGVKPAEKKLFGPSDTTSTPVATISRVEEEVVAEEAKNTLFSGPPDLVL